MQITLRTRMRFLVIALLVTLGVGSILTFKVLANNELNLRVETNATDTSRLIGRFIDKSQTDLQQKVKLIGQLTTFKRVLLIPDVIARYKAGLTDDTVGSQLDYYCPEISVDSLALMNPQGQIVGASPNWPKDMPDLMKYEGVRDVFNGAMWSGLSSDQGTLHTIVIAPVKISDQGLYGALIGVRHIGEKECQEFKENQNNEVLFLDREQPLAGSIPYKGPIKMDPHALQFIEYNGAQYVGMYRQLASSQAGQKLGFVALEDYSVLTSFGRSAGAAFILILVLMTAVGLAFGERFTSSLVRPLDELVRAAGEMRKGQTPKPFTVGSRPDEVGVLQTVFNDMVTAVEQNNKLLLGMIDTDPLTSLGNHRSFQEKLRAEILRARHSEQPLSVILVDLDHFHEFNLTRGHAEGDTQLKAYASLIRATCPGSAYLARYSGDQFVALLPNHTTDEAQQVAIAIRKAASEDSKLIPTSIGISQLDPSSPNEEALVLSAELALSRAKQLGRNRISLFESDLESETPGGSELLQKYLTDGSLATVQALAAAVDAKDQYTQGHSERVANLARELAEYMNCSPAFIELVYRAGTLHDVGKIGVPDAILSKPDRLTDEEMSVMETHPVLGEVIVSKVPQLAPLLPGVRFHHERWDGRGYPDGLAGESIPTMARYLAVADTFDAMTSNRPYRRALDPEVALAEIEKNAGTQFQAELAHAFVKMIRQNSRVESLV